MTPYTELERTWMFDEKGSLNEDRFFILYVIAEVTNGGYGRNLRYVVQCREQGDVCVECGADFKATVKGFCKHGHPPDRSYLHVVNGSGFTRDQAAEIALRELVRRKLIPDRPDQDAWLLHPERQPSTE